MSAAQYDDDDDDIELDAEVADVAESANRSESRLDAFGWALLRCWGILFRTLSITIVGVVGYFWLDPQSIGDVPLSELTLNQILKNVFAFAIAIGCISWFFKFPDTSDATSPENNPYVTLGKFGGWVVLVVGLGIYLLNK
jgi:hypothetical protein